ncbi:hypothetical protein COCOBI_13-0840 [Coccomyxa sp. Obi]|nr:hypothetical protein COCOBI_13-0840 [Coccomyxa sp. Obi]
MSLESLGSMARTINDRFLRENLRRMITGTNTSISSVLEGFRGQGSEVDGPDTSGEPLQHDEPQPGPSAFEDFARGGSYARQSSDTTLKRRNSSFGRRAPGQQPQQRGRSELHTIHSATSLQYPVSPRAQKKPTHRQQSQAQQSNWKWSRVLTVAIFTAWAILGVCFLMGTWLPHHSADLAQGVQSPAASWRLLSMLRTSTPRHLLEEGLGAPLHHGTARHRHGEDAFSAAAKRLKHQEHASRWGQHMAGRMSRSLAEGDTTGNNGAAATAEAPDIAATTVTSARQAAAARFSATGQSSSSSNAGSGQSAAERAAAAGASSGGGSGASVGGAAFGGVSLLQQDGSVDNTAQSSTTAGASANTLQYSNGYVNVTGPYYRMVQHTQNHGVCAAACAADAPCTAWTRVAAGRPDVQACYLRSSSPGDTNTFFTTAVQYVAPSQASQVVLESGTKSPDALPAALYGCPYPPSRNGGCQPPPSCNCYQGVCYGDC